MICHICKENIDILFGSKKLRKDKEGWAHDNCIMAKCIFTIKPSGLKNFNKRKKMWPDVVNKEEYEKKIKIIEDNTIGEFYE